MLRLLGRSPLRGVSASGEAGAITARARTPLVRLVVALLLLGGGTMSAHASNIDHGRAPAMAARAPELHVLRLLNAHRAAHGVGALTINLALTRVARAHSRDMFVRHYFAHETPDGQSPFQRIAAAGIHYQTAGENLGQATGYAPTEAANVLDAAMMAEPPHQENHRAIILDRDFHKVGVGIYTSGSAYYLTEDFTN